MANIREVAMREFAEKGWAGARVDAIADASRTSKRMIYYYFGSKEGLYIAVLGNQTLRLIAIMLLVTAVGTVLNVVAGVGKMKLDEVTRGAALHDGTIYRHVLDGFSPLARRWPSALLSQLIGSL